MILNKNIIQNFHINVILILILLIFFFILLLIYEAENYARNIKANLDFGFFFIYKKKLIFYF